MFLLKKILKFKIKKHFAKGHATNWSEEVFVISKIKNTVPWASVISDLNGKKILELFMKKNRKKQIKKNL